MSTPISIPSVSVTYAQDGSSTRWNTLGMRPMQERVYQKRGGGESNLGSRHRGQSSRPDERRQRRWLRAWEGLGIRDWCS